MTPVYCREDEQLLGYVGPSLSSMKNHRPVWHIQAGWRWHPLDKVLTFDDVTYSMERRLAHEILADGSVKGVSMGREVDLDGFGLRVRCPKCRKVRIFNSDNVFRSLIR